MRPLVGLAVDFKLLNMDGTEVSLSGLLVDKPCDDSRLVHLPPFRQRYAATYTLYKRYAAYVHFLVIHTIEAHPVGEHNPCSTREVLSKYSADAYGLPVYQPSS